MTEHFDKIIIGTGQAGPALAVRLAASGRRTAILERKRFGGSCVNVGCIPTKTLVASARAAYVARNAAELRVNAECLRVSKRNDGVAVHLSCEDEPREIVGSHLLLAVGRVPNTDDLGLERAGVATDARGFIVVDDQLATNVPGVWALGDVNGHGAFTHTAYNDYEIVAANLLDGDPRRVSDRFPVYALFTDPPLARAGMTEQEARASGRPILVGRMAMRVGRARERRDARIHAGPGRRRDQTNSRCLAARHRGRQGHPLRH